MIMILVVSLSIIFFALFSLKERENEKQFQQKLNFICSPGVAVRTMSNRDSDFVICLMKPNSKEFVVREIAK